MERKTTINSKITSDNTIFYSTANAGYAVYAAVSLLTIRDHIPAAKLCILSSGLSAYDKKILQKNHIDYNEIDLRKEFTRTWEYPIDCYYIFAGPEMFCEQGYKYSVYVDGDVLCYANPLDGVGEVKGVAGATSAPVDGIYTSIFGEDWEKISLHWSLGRSIARKPRINSGVVYFNNQYMSRISLLKKAGELFRQSVKHDMPRKGDDSLFSLFQYVHLKENEVRHLFPEYNFVLQFNEWRYPVKNLKFFHFSIDKPWKKKPYSHDDPRLNIFNPYVRKWRIKLLATAPKSWARTIYR